MRDFVKYNYGALTWALFILALLFIPTGGLEDSCLSDMDKLVHFIIFGMQSYLTITGQYKQRRFSCSRENSTWYSLFAVMAFGCCTEFIQYLLGYRSFDMWDMAANSLGAFAGFLYFEIWVKSKMHRHYNQIV